MRSSVTKHMLLSAFFVHDPESDVFYAVEVFMNSFFITNYFMMFLSIFVYHHTIFQVVLAPTRELAAQCHSMTENLARHTDIRCCLIVGGLSMQVWTMVVQNLFFRLHV